MDSVFWYLVPSTDTTEERKVRKFFFSSLIFFYHTSFKTYEELEFPKIGSSRNLIFFEVRNRLDKKL